MSEMRHRIVLVSALQEELDPLWRNTDFEWSTPQEHGDAVWYRRCILDGYEIISACAGEVGLTATTILLTKLILRWRPLVVIMFGICAGRRDAGLELGDVVFSSSTSHYQAGHFRLGRFEPKQRRAQTTEQIAILVKQFLSKQPPEDLWSTFDGGVPRIPTLFAGDYASADLVLKDLNKLEEAVRSNADLRALEMESHAVLHTANHFGVPLGGLVIKAVSDHGDRNKAKTGREFVKFAAVQAAMQFVRHAIIPSRPVPASPSYYESHCPQLRHDSTVADEKRILLLCSDRETLMQLVRSRHSWHALQTSTDTSEPFFQLQLNSALIIATCMHQGSIGVIDGSLRATELFITYAPVIGIMLGPCGGFSTRVKIGDVVIASRLFHYQFGAYRDGDIQPEIRSVDVTDRLKGFLGALSGSQFQKIVARAHQSFDLDSCPRPDDVPRWHTDPIGSADLFVKDLDKINEIIALDRKVAAIDMEGYSFMRSAQQCNVKFGGLVVRSVGDLADEPPGAPRYRSYASRRP